MVIRRVLCPVDFSEPSRRALHHAVAVAGRYDCELHVLHVIQDVMPAAIAWHAHPSPRSLTEVRHLTWNVFDEFVAPTQARPVMTQMVREGRPYCEIVDYAAEVRADLIVMATHGATGLDRVILGSTTERVLRTAGCPVMTIPSRGDEPGSADRARFTHVLCAVDFAPMSLHALDYGLSLAKEDRLRTTVLHVIELPMDEESFGQGSLPLSRFIEHERHQALERLAHAIGPDARAWCQPVETVRTGRPASVILNVADRGGVDLIVMGVQGRRTFAQPFLGSTTRTVIHRAVCPVLTTRVGPAFEQASSMRTEYTHEATS